MGQLIVYGASDDLAEFEGHADGEIPCWESTVEVLIGERNRLTRLQLRHTSDLGWIISVLMPTEIADENEWDPYPIKITHNRYSPLATVDLPAGCPVRAFVDGLETPIY